MEKLDIVIIVLAIVLCVVLVGTTIFGEVIETASWGLSFETEGLPPAGPVPADKLAKFGGYYMGDPQEKTIYLTFDAGYENGCTAQILDALKKHNAPGTFFLVGNYMEQNADLVRRMVKEGHTVGNHTVHHKDMSKITDAEAFTKELTDLEKMYEEITGEKMEKVYRPPMGIYSEDNLKMAQKLGYKTVFWSLAYADWDNDHQPDPKASMDTLTNRLHPGAVVLLHATSQTNAKILDELLTRWEDMGYRFAPISELGAQPPEV